MQPAIRVENLAKRYRINHAASGRHNYRTLRESLAGALKTSLRRLKSPTNLPPRNEEFWALKDVSFDIQPGEVVGIIGRNGAGKSTLLKILSRITKPTGGHVTLRGRVGSLLEVGTGFHPELTGRENVYLNGSILGMSRREIDRQFDAIVDFSGVEKFLDTPVKRYSSGMYVRLAFAVAAHLNPGILIVDEVLAVGDVEFQKKCLGKMKDVATDGRTVLFVSHNMQAINLLCTRGIYLKEGKVAMDGPASAAVAAYTRGLTRPDQNDMNADRRPGSGEYRFARVRTTRPIFNPGEPVTVNFSVCHHKGQVGRMYLSAHLVDEMGAIVVQCDSRLVGAWLNDLHQKNGVFQMNTPWLKPGSYRLDLFLCSPELTDVFENAGTVVVSPVWPYPHSVSNDGVSKGSVLSEFQWRFEADQNENQHSHLHMESSRAA